MEERVYQGNVTPNGLADSLVSTFGQYEDLTAQKLGQGDNLLVQIGRVRGWSGRVRGVIGVSITKVPDGIRVTAGQSNWLEANSGLIAGAVVSAIIFPPLLIFPLMRGVRDYAFYQDIWNAIDDFCLSNNAVVGATNTTHAVYCQRCGSVNSEDARECSICGAPLHAPQPTQTPYYTPPQQRDAASQPSAHYTSPQQRDAAPQSSAQYKPQQREAPSEQAPASTPSSVPSQVTCPRCGATVAATKYCGNCGSELPQQAQTAQ